MLKYLLQEKPEKHLFGFKCRSCSFCEDLSSFLESRDLRSIADLKRFAYAVSPQVLPNGLPELGITQYRIDPFSINLLSEGESPIYISLLDGLGIGERIRIFDLIREVRALEWKSLSGHISLDLAEIIDQRRVLARNLGTIEDSLVPYALYSSVGLSNLFPLLLDDRVSEFFVDREWSLAYLDHRDFGRCNTALYIGSEGMRHLLTFSRMMTGKAMDYLSPSLRSSIKTPDFYVRISADAPPLSLEGTSMAVRKFFSKPMSLKELIVNFTLSSEAAAYLNEKLNERKSFTIYGESGSGKTTLAVALDLLTPSKWRKISVESDVAENVTQSHLGKHQIRLLAGSASKAEQDRRIQILNSLLHKSPDYVFLGEVLSKEDSESLFQILASGLKCIHTIHAESAESLFGRWIFQHTIPPQSLKDLDVMVEMRKLCIEGKIFRRVYRICEVVKNTNTEIPRINDIFHWDNTIETLKMVDETILPLHEFKANWDEAFNQDANIPKSIVPRGF
jgi:type IV secretory pathway ATPase VirB11/archaellum biosynthesis ATPase